MSLIFRASRFLVKAFVTHKAYTLCEIPQNLSFVRNGGVFVS